MFVYTKKGEQYAKMCGRISRPEGEVAMCNGKVLDACYTSELWLKRGWIERVNDDKNHLD